MNQNSRSFNRRQALRLLGGAALAMPIGLGVGDPVRAARGWCLADPVLKIGGQFVHVYIGSDIAMLDSATDKIKLFVTVPIGVRARLEDIEADFGEGYRVRFFETAALVATGGHIPVELAVYAPARDSALPVVVDFSPVGSGPLTATSAQGTANAWILLATH